MKNVTKKLLSLDGQPLTMNLLSESIIAENVKKQYGKHDLKHLQGELMLRQSSMLELCRGMAQVTVIDAAYILNTMCAVLDDICSDVTGKQCYLSAASSKTINNAFKNGFYDMELSKVLSICEGIVPVLNKCAAQFERESLLPATAETFIQLESLIKAMYFDMVFGGEITDITEKKIA